MLSLRVSLLMGIIHLITYANRSDHFNIILNIKTVFNCSANDLSLLCCIVNRPREFIDCVGHIRVLSWLLIGSLTHTAVTRTAAVTVCQPLSLEASSYIADHIMVIMTGFAEQSKVSEWFSEWHSLCTVTIARTN